ncbi:MAG TPA: DUF6484 domain-containing protein [Polyangia bacterium]|nr:DUF6484 domain-containing protein [Polyangia bacterium]
MTSREPKPKRVATASSCATSPIRVGHLAPGSAPGALRVTLPNGGPPVPARTTIVLDDAQVAHAVQTRQAVVLLFENGDVDRPIVVGMVQPDAGAGLFGALLAQQTKSPSPPPVSPGPVSRPAAPAVARVDGKRVVIEGKDEVTLKCGDASITLLRDGKMILRGAYVETTAKGVNRIRGGSVKIN